MPYDTGVENHGYDPAPSTNTIPIDRPACNGIMRSLPCTKCKSAIYRYTYNMCRMSSEGLSEFTKSESYAGRIFYRLYAMSPCYYTGMGQRIRSSDDGISIDRIAPYCSMLAMPYDKCIQDYSAGLLCLPCNELQHNTKPESSRWKIFISMCDVPYHEYVDPFHIQPFKYTVLTCRSASSRSVCELPCE